MVTWRGREGSSSSSRMGSQPPCAEGSAGREVGAAGLRVPCRLQSRAGGWAGFALFLDPTNGGT